MNIKYRFISSLQYPIIQVAKYNSIFFMIFYFFFSDYLEMFNLNRVF